MFSPEVQQIEICLLKSNLEEIEKDLVAQVSAVPTLDNENEQKFRDTTAALRVARSLNSEIERLKQESVRLTAKRLQLKRQCEEVSESLERAREHRSELEDLLKQEENDTELELRRYEDTLRKLADRFRTSRAFYNEEDLNRELEIVKELNLNFKSEEKSLENDVSKLKNILNSIQTVVPVDILNIIGQVELENKLKSLTAQCEALRSKQDYLMKNRARTAALHRK